MNLDWTKPFIRDTHRPECPVSLLFQLHKRIRTRTLETSHLAYGTSRKTQRRNIRLWLSTSALRCSGRGGEFDTRKVCERQATRF